MSEVLLFGRRGDKLSNFALCDLKVVCPFCQTTMACASVEHGFQAFKTTNCQDFHAILACNGPAAARSMGKKILLRPDWDEVAPSGVMTVKAEVMLDMLEKKFALEPFQSLLLATEDKLLIEDAPWDRYWGAGPNGRGKNALGRLMMMVRADLRGHPLAGIPEQTPFVDR